MSIVHHFRKEDNAYRWDGVAATPLKVDGIQGAVKNILIGDNEGAPHFIMRYFELEPGGHSWLETHPHGCFCVFLEQVPFPKPTLEGRLQRQLKLYDRGLHIIDPMSFFEEITRFKLMKGILPTDMLYSPDQLDVLAAAYTAWLATHRPEEVTRLGDRSEGQMILPVGELKEKY